MGKKKKKEIPWDLIRADYNTGLYSVNFLGKKYQIHHSSIQNKIKREDWTQDQVLETTAAIAKALGLENVIADNKPQQTATADDDEKQRQINKILDAKGDLIAVEEKMDSISQAQAEAVQHAKRQFLNQYAVTLAAQTAVEAVRQHKQSLRTLSEVTDNIGYKLHQALSSGQTIEDSRSEGWLGEKESFSDAIDKVARSAQRLIMLERQAWGLDKGEKTSTKVMFSLNLGIKTGEAIDGSMKTVEGEKVG